MNPVLTASINHARCTPRALLDAITSALGPIQLDPCSNPQQWTRAVNHYVHEQGYDGLALPWVGFGLTYVNCPYGRALPQWCMKAVREAELGAEIVLLTPARTETRWFELLRYSATALAFLRGRQTFVDPYGNPERDKKGNPTGAPFPSLLTYFGPRREAFVTAFEPRSTMVL